MGNTVPAMRATLPVVSRSGAATNGPYRRGPIGRKLHYLGHILIELFVRHLAKRLLRSPVAAKVLTRLPHMPTRFVPWLASPATAWTEQIGEPPQELRTVAGIQRDPTAEADAYDKTPLHYFFRLHADALAALLPVATMIAPAVTTAPRVESSTRQLISCQDEEPERSPAQTDPALLTAELKKYAATLGVSATGVTPFNPKYTFAEYADKAVGDRVVVCVLEQNYGATQRIPSYRSEQAALATYGELEDRRIALAQWLRDRGWRARPETYVGESMFIAYAVAAGLGQLGLNGQLLTPYAGSRCRLNVLTTNAPRVCDEPVDYGIEGVCDRCQICVRRCPVGAIPNHRSEHRGIIKAKLNTKRCLPLMMQTSGCSICMKVCPVQRYGLRAVLDEYRRSGQILGKDTDDLEGFDWPLDGRHYGPNEKPHVPASVVRPPGFNLDPTRTEPPADAPDTDGLIGGMFVLDPPEKHPGIDDPRN
jgi:epoxyqueuosine reductase